MKRRDRKFQELRTTGDFEFIWLGHGTSFACGIVPGFR